MCGICGVFEMKGHANITEERLRAMADTMTHRGPDDWGTYLSPERRAGFGFRRLSIVDLSPDGHQPMSNLGCVTAGLGTANGSRAGATVWVVFNGEIYNHLSLRQELERRGHIYHSRTDTEAIIHGYEEWGEEVVERLRGMFAFALYDRRTEERLFLARDRLGIKPLYYAEDAGVFLFASEIKALLQWRAAAVEVDEATLWHYLTISASPAPRTMFNGISKLRPGHTMTLYANGRSEMRQYWEALPEEGVAGATETETVKRLREMLRESIRLRMMSDVPFGVFLSGGVDSSLNVALMSELMDRPVDTFSVAIQDDAASNELSQAKVVAHHYKANHHEVVITPQQFVETMPLVVHHQDEPLADPVCVPLYHVSKLARNSGTIVVQVGEGADELFAGYAGYAQMADFHRRVYEPFMSLPGWLKRPAAALAPVVLPHRRAEYVRRAAEGEELFWGGALTFTENEKERLVVNGSGDGHVSTYAHVIAQTYGVFDTLRPRSGFLDRIIYLELKHRLPELLLMRVDKMSMATSVEARVPYLDHELVQFALAIPASLKYHKGQSKYILKQAARGVVPDEVIDRPKIGFCGSARNMVSGPVLDYAERVLNESGWLPGVMNMDMVHGLLHEHRTGRADHGPAIWSLTNLELWHRCWIERRPVPA
jgi:asparagine synthase (glutamine-hydrolysing)